MSAKEVREIAIPIAIQIMERSSSAEVALAAATLIVAKIIKTHFMDGENAVVDIVARRLREFPTLEEL